MYFEFKLKHEITVGLKLVGANEIIPHSFTIMLLGRLA